MTIVDLRIGETVFDCLVAIEPDAIAHQIDDKSSRNRPRAAAIVWAIALVASASVEGSARKASAFPLACALNGK